MEISRYQTHVAAKIILLFALTSLIFLPYSFAQDADFNPKSVDSITMKITQSGTLEVTGDVQRANLTLYIPQEGLQSLNVASNSQMSWKYSADAYGNRVVVMEFVDPSGTVTYSLESVVNSRAKFVNPTSDIDYDTRYLNQTKSIVITDEIKKLAYPYERTWDNVAYLTELVYDLVEYDINVVGERRSSDWVLENKRGVCVEHANLLTALLRASGIPTRYVVGYAYSTVDKKLIGHTWIEVLASDGTWVPFDPTWLQGGFLDATHIKTASLLDDNQIDVLTYVGSGRITWKRGSFVTENLKPGEDLYSDKVEILTYTLANITSIGLQSQRVPLGGYGYIKADVRPDACLINQLNIQSCVDKSRDEVFEIYDKERKFFSCSSKELYWFFRETDGSGNYLCPVTVYDQLGSSEDIEVETRDAINPESLSITGPTVVEVNELFTLKANYGTDFIFYSPDLGRSRDDDWDLQIKRAGDYNFYLYENGNLARKTVKVVEKKEFDIALTAPTRVKAGSNFTVNVTMKNLDTARNAVFSVEFDGFRKDQTLKFAHGETKEMVFNLTASQAGAKEIYVSLQADTLTPLTFPVTVEGRAAGGSWIDGIINGILGVLGGIKDFFSGLFGR